MPGEANAPGGAHDRLSSPAGVTVCHLARMLRCVLSAGVTCARFMLLIVRHVQLGGRGCATAEPLGGEEAGTLLAYKYEAEHLIAALIRSRQEGGLSRRCSESEAS